MAEDIQWSDPLEEITKQEAERCLALAWAHGESQRWCMRWDTTLMFPSIILATFSGAGSIGADKLLPFNGAATLVGIISLVVGTLQTIQNYFAFSKNAEGHRIAALQYGKLHSQLQTQLALPRRERKRAEEIIDWLQQERDRLCEIVPLIPAPIKKMFHEKFGLLENFAMPANLNGLTPVFVTRHLVEVVAPARVDIAHGRRLPPPDR